MAEVSEKSPEEAPTKEKQESVAQVLQQEAMPQPSVEEAVPEQVAEVEESLPPEIAELNTILELLRVLTAQCETSLLYTSRLANQGKTQDAIAEYAKALGVVPKTLQLLNDYRRHGKRLEQDADELQQRMITLRGGDQDALTSEEIRVLEETKAAKPNMIDVIGQLENVLQHVRNTTRPLLSLVHYDRPGFPEFATHALQDVRIDWVSQVVHQINNRITALRNDLIAFYDLIDHANGLENVSETT